MNTQHLYRIVWRCLATASALTIAATARADVVLSTPAPQVAAGAPLELTLTVTNDSQEPLALTLSSPMHVRFETADHVAVGEFVPEVSGALSVEPGRFARVRLRGVAPAEMRGSVTLQPTGLSTNALALQLNEPSAAPAFAQTPAQEMRPQDADLTATLVDKPPPLALSVYEPVYVIVGGDGGLNAKFQISFRYRMFDGRGALARRLPWIDDLYLSFSQTSLWDLNELSKPLRDSSYRPRLFFANYDLARYLDGQLRLGVETGFGHESNGKDAEDSRSFNMAYVRPTVTFGDPDGLRFYLAPLIHNYIADDENPDLKDYRGYVDWVIGAGSKGGLDFWATLRKGTRSDFGSMEINASYPLSKLSDGDLTGWLTLQYFAGYGESLIDYSRKLDAQVRMGIAVAL